MKKAILYLEDGRRFIGASFGAGGTCVAEVVFNTSMTGYQEILTDPSYSGQMVVMTCPHMGNTGVNEADAESTGRAAEGLIVCEYTDVPSNWRATTSLDQAMKEAGIIGMHRIDTRALTRHLRAHGAMLGVISTEIFDAAELKKRLAAHPGMAAIDWVGQVSCTASSAWTETVDGRWYHTPVVPLPGGYHIAAFDFGIKQNILRLMTGLGFKVTRLPARTTAASVRALKPDGVFLSNGPGDPQALPDIANTVATLADDFPIFGICLGHQLISLAFGAETYKLKYGHHGGNHPVKELSTGRVAITAQNHNYAVRREVIEEAGFAVTHLNLNDGTVEGMQHRTRPIFSVQYHPEAAPGPHDAVPLFQRFHEMIRSL